MRETRIPPTPHPWPEDDDRERLRRCLELAIPLSAAAWLAIVGALVWVWLS